METQLSFEYQMKTVEEVRDAQRAQGLATILAIGTANPPNCIYQTDYSDFLFRVTNNEHKTELKDKFKRLCEESMVKKRYFHLTEDVLKENPNIATYKRPSLDTRQSRVTLEVPKLGQEAALKALKEWGQAKSKITHLLFCSSTGVALPGADFQLTKLLGLRPTVKRIMMNNLSSFAGGSALRLAKDLAENNAGARVLIVCSENMTISFHGPSETHLDILIGQSLFGDGAAAVIVGADPDTSIEHPIFQIVLGAQTTIPDSEDGVGGLLLEMGLSYYFSEKVPNFIADNIEQSLVEAVSPIGISDWNSLFWIVHPGSPAILDEVESKLGLKEEKLGISRHVLSEYGNMWSASVIFGLDEMRKKSLDEEKNTTGEGLEWGVLLAFGPGMTVETLVLHSIPIDSTI